ncbi:phosphorylase family protein [Sorangium sp. So ce1099]|uniref:5'-methylthioadenosine/S-adenosylhomocysteine nucleosidase family protein n=1 Tax=Sorangium sp. So ce1099 TaxID=3133331 RepID=UPI003F6194A0
MTAREHPGARGHSTIAGATLHDAVRLIRARLEDDPDIRPLIRPRILVDIHYYLAALEQDIPALITTLSEDTTRATELIESDAWRQFDSHLWRFATALSGLSLNLLDIYQPGLGEELAQAYGADSVVYGYFDGRYGDSRATPGTRTAEHGELLELAAKFRELDRARYFYWDQPDALVTSDECLTALTTLASDLRRCKESLADLIRRAAPLGAAVGSVRVYWGDMVMGSTFNTNIAGSTIGVLAVGDHEGASAVGHVTQGSTASSPLEGDTKAPAEASTGSGSMQHAAEAPIDFAILTAIEVERKAVCAAFGLGQANRVKKEGRTYWSGKLPLKNGEHYAILVAQPRDMGQVEAALLASDVIRHWSPTAALLVGIAASTDKDVQLGDVVVGRSVYYYEHGKVTAEGTKPQPEMIMADAALLAAAVTLDWEETVPDRPDGSEAQPKRHLGVIASGEKVIASAAARDAIIAPNRKILALEMEGHGFSRAVWQSFEHVRHLDIRGICDDGSEKKDDRWHKYAATAAAAFAKHFLADRPLESRRYPR